MTFKKIATVQLPGLEGDRLEMENGNQGGKLDIDLNELTNSVFESYTPKLQELVNEALAEDADRLKIY